MELTSDLLAIQKKRWLRLSLALILFSALMLGFAGYQVAFVPDPAYRLLAAISLAVLLLTLVSIGLMNKGKARVASFLISSTVWIALLVIPLFYAKTGLINAFLGVIYLAMLGGKVFSQRAVRWITGITILIGLSGLLADWYGAEARPAAFPGWMIQAITAGIAAAIFIYLIFRFRSFPLRTKLLTALMIISALAATIVAAVSVVNARNSLRATSEQALLVASSQTANAVDSFIYSVMESLETEAQLPVFHSYLVLPTGQQTAEALAEVNDTFDVLRQRATLQRMSESRLEALQAYLLVNQNGEVIADTSGTQLGQSVAENDYFREPFDNFRSYLSSTQFNAKGQTVFYFGSRINDPQGRAIGVLVARYAGSVFHQIIQENNDLVGKGSFGILIDENALRLGQGVTQESLYRFLIPLSGAQIAELKEVGSFPAQMEDYLTSELADLSPRIASLTDRSYLSFQLGSGSPQTYLAANVRVKSLDRPWQVFYVQSESLLLTPIENQVRNTQVLALLIAGAAALTAIPLSNLLTAPVRRLTEVTGAVTSGNLNARAKVEVNDEIGSLANAINQMTGELQQNMIGLEQRVNDRTRDLEKRSLQLQSAAEIGRTVASIRNLDELLSRVTRMISERFAFYHVGIFLIDAEGKFAVLRAANSEGGQMMLSRGHRLEVGQQGIVGYVTCTGKPRIALDVGEDPQFFNNPDLPLTRSEMALPLSIAGKIMGALDVQSVQPGAFGREDVSVLQVMADLVAIAIENARLFTSSQEALETSRRAYGELSKRAWMDLLSSRADLSYTSSEYPSLVENAARIQAVLELQAAGARMKDEPEPDAVRLSLPIKVRDVIIGTLETYKPGSSGSWTPEEYDMVTTIIDQLGVALESARLYESSQSRAERERLIGEVASRMRESLDVDAVLRSTVVELRQALGLAQVEVRLKSSQENG